MLRVDEDFRVLPPSFPVIKAVSARKRHGILPGIIL